MPDIQLTPMQAFYFLLVVFAIPAQYFLYEWTGNTERHRADSIARLLDYFKNFRNSHLTVSSWKTWVEQHIKTLLTKEVIEKTSKRKGFDVKTQQSFKRSDYAESVAEEVFWYASPNGHFAASVSPRSPRPSRVKFRVGQVIRHKRFGYHGVIIGWDEVCKAPLAWIQQNHGTKEHWKNQPNYAVLVDTRNRKEPQITYVVQENMEVVSNTRIVHPHVDDYFDFYDGAQYHMRPAMRTIYPHD